MGEREIELPEVAEIGFGAKRGAKGGLGVPRAFRAWIGMKLGWDWKGRAKAKVDVR